MIGRGLAPRGCTCHLGSCLTCTCLDCGARGPYGKVIQHSEDCR